MHKVVKQMADEGLTEADLEASKKYLTGAYRPRYSREAMSCRLGRPADGKRAIFGIPSHPTPSSQGTHRLFLFLLASRTSRLL